MSDEHAAIPYGRVPGSDRGDRDVDVEILIGRLIDGEASASDRARFETLASRTPGLWRDLALRHQDMVRLGEAFETGIAPALEVELPRAAASRRSTSWRTAVALSGWAAMLVVALGWALAATGARPVGEPLTGVPAGEVRPRVEPLSPDEHFDRYLLAPNVLGEMQPLVLQVEEMSDGRLAVRYVRRIEEVAIVPTPEDLPVNDDGELTASPSELRSSVPRQASPD